jgi:dTDP-4-dehydrorhamnose 3,5-epimerase
LIFQETGLEGCWLIDIEPIEDARGFFARSFCQGTFAEHGLDPACAQCNISYNRTAGTVRGMHYQIQPYEEAKLVRCTAGAIHDVVVDLRPHSPSFARHFAVELTARNRRMLFVPRGFAHGFQTLADDTEVFYQMSTPYVPDSAAGFRYDDVRIGASWPLPVSLISDRDLALPPFDPERFRHAT